MKREELNTQTSWPDLEWYVEKSRTLKRPARCPFATEKLCPRYYSTLELFGQNGVNDPISKNEKLRLDAHWDSSPLFTRGFQPQPGIMMEANSSVTFWHHCCPELVFHAWKIFAANGRHFADKYDQDFAHRELKRQGVSDTDPRWHFARFQPAHYSECTEFSILVHIGSAKAQPPLGSPRRPGVSPKLRWEVLARDNYTCQYCGRKPPEVELHVDHKVSVHNDGQSELANLITSCAGCNLGKSKRNA